MSIKKDLISWSEQVLEVPNKFLKGLPACPYAKEAWAKNKVEVIETDDVFEDTLSWSALFENSEKDVVIIASYYIPDIEVFESFIEEINKSMGEMSDLYFMGFHPEFGAEDKELEFLLDNNWQSELDYEYCLVFIQSLTKVVKASNQLEKLGYYEAYPDDEYQALVIDRKRKLKNGDEEKTDD